MINIRIGRSFRVPKAIIGPKGWFQTDFLGIKEKWKPNYVYLDGRNLILIKGYCAFSFVDYAKGGSPKQEGRKNHTFTQVATMR